MFENINIYIIIYFNISGLELYSERLVKEGIVSIEDLKSVKDKYDQICEEALELAKKETHIKVI